MLGDLIAQLDRPDVVEAVLATLPATRREDLQRRATEVGMTIGDFASGAVHEFVERADDDLWFQLLTVMRRADDPGLAAVQTILGWVMEPQR
jgi:hypothetical protein